ELINDDLRAVDEIAELRLPLAEHLRVIERVAVVEAEYGGLGQQRVVHAEFRLAGRDTFEGHVTFARLRIIEHRVALAERAAAAILAAEPDRRALDQQGAPGERLGEGPVDGAALGVRLRAV